MTVIHSLLYENGGSPFPAELRGLAMIKLLLKFASDERGATAIEYGLIAAGISLAILGSINGLGTKLGSKFTAINTSLK